MGEYLESLKRHLTFGKKEVNSILVASLIMAFAFAFDDKSESFEIAYWVGNFLLFLLAVLVSLLFRIVVQKAVGIKSGFRVEFKTWTYGLAIGAAVTIISNGKLIILLPGGVLFYHLAAERLGHFRYGLNMQTCAWIAGMGSVANMVAGMFLQQLMNMFEFQSALFDRFIYVNFLLALFMMMPLPPLDGMTAFFGNRMGFVILFGLIFAYVALFLAKIYSLIFAVIIAVVVWAVYYIVVEHG